MGFLAVLAAQRCNTGREKREIEASWEAQAKPFPDFNDLHLCLCYMGHPYGKCKLLGCKIHI